eukprot:Opistho-1_new@69380
MSVKKTSEGLLLIDKPKGVTSFSLIATLRRLSHIRKIGHAGTLDPFATGVMVLLVGKSFTRLSNHFLHHDKEYQATLHLGITSTTFDEEGILSSPSPYVPTLSHIEATLADFQGEISQIPPMFSAKKVQGKKLYELARKGITIERKPALIRLKTQLISYTYPYLELLITCSKGTYIRSLAHDIGEKLTCGAYLTALKRTRSGPFTLKECLASSLLKDPLFPWQEALIHPDILPHVLCVDT